MKAHKRFQLASLVNKLAMLAFSGKFTLVISRGTSLKDCLFSSSRHLQIFMKQVINPMPRRQIDILFAKLKDKIVFANERPSRSHFFYALSEVNSKPVPATCTCCTLHDTTQLNIHFSSLIAHFSTHI